MRVSTSDFGDAFDNMPKEYQEYIREHLVGKSEIDKAIEDHKPRWMLREVGDWVYVQVVSRTQYNGASGILYRWAEEGAYLLGAAVDSITLLSYGEWPQGLIRWMKKEHVAIAEAELSPPAKPDYSKMPLSAEIEEHLCLTSQCPDCDTVLEDRAINTRVARICEMVQANDANAIVQLPLLVKAAADVCNYSIPAELSYLSDAIGELAGILRGLGLLHSQKGSEKQGIIADSIKQHEERQQTSNPD